MTLSTLKDFKFINGKIHNKKRAKIENGWFLLVVRGKIT
jgi:hypothetical protein